MVRPSYRLFDERTDVIVLFPFFVSVERWPVTGHNMARQVILMNGHR